MSELPCCYVCGQELHPRRASDDYCGEGCQRRFIESYWSTEQLPPPTPWLGTRLDC